MSPSDNIGVMIVEDDPGTREGLAVLVEDTEGYGLRGAFASVEEALEANVKAAPQALLLDIELPGMPGSAAVPLFRERFPEAAILMFTVYDEEARVFESICNGADGYLLKKTSPDRLLAAIREAHENGAPMSPEIARKVIRLFQKTQASPADHDLNPTEVRILRFLADGYSYQAVGDRLKLSINTIRNYIRSIYDKLHVHSKSEAVSKALRSGII